MKKMKNKLGNFAKFSEKVHFLQSYVAGFIGFFIAGLLGSSKGEMIVVFCAVFGTYAFVTSKKFLRFFIKVFRKDPRRKAIW